jgi:hypothetical protein
MLPTVFDAIRAILKADMSVTAEDRAWILACIKDHGRRFRTPAGSVQPEVKLITRAEVARLLCRSKRSIDHLANEGLLKKVMFPNRKRAAGYRYEDVVRLINGL